MDLSQRRELTQGATARSSGSFEMVLAAVVVALLGWALDGAFGLFPLLTTVLGFVGFAGSATGLYYRYRAEMQRHAVPHVGSAGAGEVAT
ncbi:MAG: AtpZ/AtpI family protein [Acidimicrobiales bacterium]